jgi:diguanylate cyclase (GGDEF)-like protein/PAS domain S-box-containing protein
LARNGATLRAERWPRQRRFGNNPQERLLKPPLPVVSGSSEPTAVDALADPVFKALFFRSPKAIALTRIRDSVIIEVNDAWCQLTGFARQKVLGMTAVELGIWASESDRELAMRPLQLNGELRHAEVTMAQESGLPRVMCVDAVRVDVAPESYVLIYLHDITAEQMAQAALQAGEKALEQANEKLNRQLALHQVTESVAKVGSWVVYPGDAMVHLSHGYCEIGHLGDANRAPIGEQLDWIMEEDRDHVKHALQRMDGGIVEYRWRRPDGTVIWLRSRMHRQIEHGVVKAEFGVVQDISQERAALDSAAEQLSAAQQSEARFRSLTELTSDWYWEQDDQFRFVRVDGDLDTARSIPSESYLGLTRWGSGVTGVSEARWAAHRAALEAHEEFHDFEMKRLRADGSVMWVSISGTPIFDSNGVFVGYRGTGREISARKQAEAEIERLAFFDALTGLPNRRLLIDRLTQAVAASARHASYGALLFIDLDNFKILNDTRGHHMGDQLLKQVAARLTDCVRVIDTVARLGGDEFVVMLEELGESEMDSAAQAEAVGKKILTALNHYFELDGQPHHSSPSIGVTLFFDRQQSVDELLRRADLAMYQSKAAGRNTLRFFDPVMQAAASARAALEIDLRHGLEQQEFLLYYQPVVDHDSKMTGVEALLRWRHPRRGMVSPGEFIPVAEQSGLILPLGQWVLTAACAQLVAWNTSATTRRLTMAVNVSARQFRHPEFTPQLLELLRVSGANPYRLKLELTESMLLNDFEDVIVKMGELRSIGVNFALDDFGTGYSSLSYLKRLPLDQLKIDQSFVRDVLTDPNDAAIARTILSLAASLELGVVAEGVETAGQRDFLLRSGCKAFQGYFFGRPVPVEDLQMSVV